MRQNIPYLAEHIFIIMEPIELENYYSRAFNIPASTYSTLMEGEKGDFVSQVPRVLNEAAITNIFEEPTSFLKSTHNAASFTHTWFC